MRPTRLAWYRLVCPGTCPADLVMGAAEAARLVRDHPAVCPSPGPAVQTFAGGAVIRPFVYADRIGG
ncbi:hypothetical protein NMK34_28680 [Micromonospora sp. BRA006-A]|uniref:hypothetical protein n=1 Tax=Micromonospora sp. BRA006-A TaxID=2962860 RepID=UPI00296FE0E5|nr:hypothetical protein [Micromonospora sp. BRA006-A]MDW3850595.1 hypothetical protein [Micromonospora sp. BRA006-A]